MNIVLNKFTREKYIAYFYDKFNITEEDIVENPHLTDLGVDSLAIIQLLNEMEHKYHLTINASMIRGDCRFEELYNIILFSNEIAMRKTADYITVKPQKLDVSNFLELIGNMYGSRIALTELEGSKINSLSYRELILRIKKVTRYIIQECIGDNIALVAENSVNWIIMHFAILCAGKREYIIDLNWSAQNVMEIINCNQCNTIVLGSDSLILHDLNMKIYPLDELISCALEMGGNVIDFPEGLCHIGEMILFTSGTTGKSKAVTITESNILCNVYSCMEKIFMFGKTILMLPLSHLFGLTASLYCGLISGVELIINHGSIPTIQELCENKIQYLLVVPIQLEHILLNLEQTPNNIETRISLKYIAVGGADINREMVTKAKRYGIHVLAGYGITECSPIVSVNKISDNIYGSSGIVLSCCKVRISSENRRKGEILVSGSNVSKSASKVILDNEEFFATGDLGMIKKNHLFISGRKKNVIVLKDGENIYPEEIEILIKEKLNIDSLVRESNGYLELCVYCGQNAKNVEPEKIKKEINRLRINNTCIRKIQKISILTEDMTRNRNGKVVRG